MKVILTRTNPVSPEPPVEKIAPTTKTGTKSTFWLDPEIFTETADRL